MLEGHPQCEEASFSEDILALLEGASSKQVVRWPDRYMLSWHITAQIIQTGRG
jgi:hypothetical protein